MDQIQTQTEGRQPKVFYTEPAPIQKRIERRMEAAKAGFFRMERAARDQAFAAGRATDAYMHRHPWQILVGAAAVGLVIGALVRRPR